VNIHVCVIVIPVTYSLGHHFPVGFFNFIKERIAFLRSVEVLVGAFPYKRCKLISNGNRTEWSPIRSVIIIVINKIGRPRRGICLTRSMTELDDTKFCYQLITPLTKFVIY